jgi:hypothetical protein
MSVAQKSRLAAGALAILRQADASVLDKKAINFPLEMFRRRWYDNDQQLWLLVNGLRYVDEAVVEKVTFYLESNSRHRAVGK